MLQIGTMLQINNGSNKYENVDTIDYNHNARNELYWIS